jgi:hypothetical protein
MKLRRRLAAAASALALIVTATLVGAATPAAASSLYRDCNPQVSPPTLASGSIFFFGGELCGGSGLLLNATLALERNGVFVPDSFVFIPSDGLLAFGQSTVPCVNGTYVGKVFANITGALGGDIDFAATQPVTITC